MEAVMIIIAVAVIAAAAILAFILGRRFVSGGERLKRRFGPEYHRAVARHEGDTRAAERELRERLRRHGAFRERPLPTGVREQYTAEWLEIQRQFVYAPREAVTGAEDLLARLAKERGYPQGPPIEEQIDAISVHHADHVHGYRDVHTVAHAPTAGTEEMRQAMNEARELFEELTADRPPATASSASSGRLSPPVPAPGQVTRRQAKGGDTP